MNWPASLARSQLQSPSVPICFADGNFLDSNILPFLSGEHRIFGSAYGNVLYIMRCVPEYNF